MMILTTSKVSFDNKETRKLRKQLRMYLSVEKKIPTVLLEQLRKSDPKAYEYFVSLSSNLS